LGHRKNTQETTMRFIITATRDEQNPRREDAINDDLFAAYMKFNEDLHQAGVLVASEGLNPGTPTARIGVAGGKRKVVDGPFAESKELIGGFYIIDVPSLEEAKKWALRCPVGMESADVLEIRQLTGAEDIPQPLLDLAAKVAPGWVKTLK
jgi:hypothetical protein